MTLQQTRQITIGVTLFLGLLAGFYQWGLNPLSASLEKKPADYAERSYHKGLLALSKPAPDSVTDKNNNADPEAVNPAEALRFFQLALNQSAGKEEVQNKSLFNLAFVKYEIAKQEKSPEKQQQRLQAAIQNLQDLLTLSEDSQPQAVALLYQILMTGEKIRAAQLQEVYAKASKTEVYPLLLEVEKQEEERQKMLLTIAREPLNLALKLEYVKLRKENRARNLALQQVLQKAN